MYDFVYVDPQTISLEDHFTSTKTFAVNYKNMSAP